MAGLFGSVLITSCTKNDDSKVPPVGGKRVFIVCEGSFGSGNSSLGAYYPDKDSVYNNVYFAANNSSLGDVFQDMAKIGNRFFLSVNNSNKVVAVSDSNLKMEATVTVQQPRYILPISGSKAYVSSLFNDKVYKLDPKGVMVTGEISFPGTNTEGMLQHNGKVFVCVWDTAINSIYMVDTSTDAIEGSMKIAGAAPHTMLLDKDQNLWVFSGNSYYGKPATITKIDPATGAILKSFTLPSTVDITKPVFNKTRDTFYFIETDYTVAANNGVFRMPILANGLPIQPFVPAQQFQYFYALGADPVNGDIYVGDPKGFTQSGAVLIYRPDGSLKKQFTTGVAPSSFYFAY